MIASRFILLLTFLFISSTHGLKGARVRSSRQLEDTAERKEAAPKEDKAADKTDDKTDKKTDKKDDKADKKTDKKEDKEDKTDKKCKKRETKKDKKEKGTSEPETPTEGVSLETKQDTPEPKEAEKFCEDPSIKKSGDCNKLKSGVLPAKSDTMAGKLVLELTPKEKPLSDMQQVMEDETTLEAVGCAKRRLQDVFDEVVDSSNSTGDEIELLAFEIGELLESDEDCANSDLGNGTVCEHVTSSIIVHFSGNASVDQQYALFDTLTNTLQDQAASGLFAEYADIHYADVTPDDVSEVGMNSSGRAADSGGGAPIGAIAGGLVAVACVAAAGAFVYIKKPFSNMESCGPSSVGPVDAGVAHVLSDDGAGGPVAAQVW